MSTCTLTCSLEVTAQNTISAKFWEGNTLKQMPPITLFSLIRASEWCFLKNVIHAHTSTGIIMPRIAIARVRYTVVFLYAYLTVCYYDNCWTLAIRLFLSASRGTKSCFLTFKFAFYKTELRSRVMATFTPLEGSQSSFIVFASKRWLDELLLIELL